MLDVKKLLAKILQAFTVSQTVTFTAYNKPWIFRKVGRVVFFDAPNDGKGFPAGHCTIGTLPVGMRPTYTQRINIGNNSNAFRFVNIESSGAVTMYNNTAYPNAVNCAVSSAFIVGGGYLTSKFYEIFSHLERWWEYVRFKETTNESADQSPVVVLQCVRKRLRQLLQGAESWQGCTRLGRILKWLVNHARWLSCVDNIITTIQTTTERQICVWRIGWNARDNRLRQYEWGCVSIYNSNHCILEFHSNLFCGVTLERGCFYA